MNEFGSLFSSPIPVSQVQSFQGLMGGNESALGEVVVGSKHDPRFDVVWPELDMASVEFRSSSMANYSVSRASSCTPVMPPPTPGEGKRKHSTEKMSSAAGGDRFKKRKVEKIQNNKVSSGEDRKEKKIKVSTEKQESKMTDQNSTKTNNNREESKEQNSKISDVEKPDYIHVRARRGQATDSHSLAERVRREKISERMRYLQDLVPGCNKISGKAEMLDEIINYVQSLQCQVEFLSMKLAASNPRLDFKVDQPFPKEVFPSVNNSAYPQFNPSQQILSCSALEMAINPSISGLCRANRAPVWFFPETVAESACFTQHQPPSEFDANLQNSYNVTFDEAGSTSFPSHPFTATLEGSTLRMET